MAREYVGEMIVPDSVCGIIRKQQNQDDVTFVSDPHDLLTLPVTTNISAVDGLLLFLSERTAWEYVQKHPEFVPARFHSLAALKSALETLNYEWIILNHIDGAEPYLCRTSHFIRQIDRTTAMG
jgi:hypothetical protein